MFWGHNLKSGETFIIEDKRANEDTVINITNASLNTSPDDKSKYTLNIIKNGESFQLCTLDHNKDSFSLNLTFQIDGAKLNLKGGNKGVVSITGFLEKFDLDEEEEEEEIKVKEIKKEKTPKKEKETPKKEKETPKKEKETPKKGKELIKKEKETPKKEIKEKEIKNDDLLEIEKDEEEEEEEEENIDDLLNNKNDDDIDESEDEMKEDDEEEEENEKKFLGKKTQNDKLKEEKKDKKKNKD